MKHKGSSAAARLFRQRGRAGLKLGHAGKVNIQTYVLRRCMLEGTRMRTYDYYVLLREEDEEIQHIQHDDQRLGKIQRSPSAAEWTFGSAGRSNAVQNRS